MSLQLHFCYNVLLAFYRLYFLYNCRFVTMFCLPFTGCVVFTTATLLQCFILLFTSSGFVFATAFLLTMFVFPVHGNRSWAAAQTRLKRGIFFVKKIPPLRIPQKKLLVMCCKAAVSAQLEIQVLTIAFHVESVLLNPAYAG